MKALQAVYMPAQSNIQRHLPNPLATYPIDSYTTPNTAAGMEAYNRGDRLATPPAMYGNGQPHTATPGDAKMSPFGSPAPKSVAFELLFTDSPQSRARIPMRVNIFPHDTTESIVTTVKNFYGLYPGPSGAKGVSFEDEEGHTLIARYENFQHNMVVYVRVIEETSTIAMPYGPSSYQSELPLFQAHYSNDGHHMPPPHPAQALNYGQAQSRPLSRASRKRSISPNGRGRRSVSAGTFPPPIKKNRSRSGFKSRGSSAHGSFADNQSDTMNGYSSGDGAPGSVSSRTKSEHLGNTEISLDNIVEGGRRKRAKFESSELPLFAPPQMPAATSNSSVSPARRMEHQRSSILFAHPGQHPFSNPQPLQSPQSYSNGFGQPAMYSTPGAQNRRTRGGASYPSQRQSTGSTPLGNSSGILPTPDPTVGSTMSEEDKDVALQLMRLGEMSNISHGRTSASTLDDTFSGKADAASSTGATSDGESESEEELPLPYHQKREMVLTAPAGTIKNFRARLDDNLPSQDSTEHSIDDGGREDGRDGTFHPQSTDDLMDLDNRTQLPESNSLPIALGKPQSGGIGIKAKSNKPKVARSGPVKSKKSGSAPSSKPISPTSLPPQSRKTSNASAPNAQHQLGEDEEDLSSKPRCQRCRKSKKGCDRQRPCQRCKDAGLSADQCVSEDEGNGRKGRYGRHMGVSVKKDEPSLEMSSIPLAVAIGGHGSPSKKRKR